MHKYLCLMHKYLCLMHKYISRTWIFNLPLLKYYPITQRYIIPCNLEQYSEISQPWLCYLVWTSYTPCPSQKSPFPPLIQITHTRSRSSPCGSQTLTDLRYAVCTTVHSLYNCTVCVQLYAQLVMNGHSRYEDTNTFR